MIFPTQKSDPELYPYRHGLYFAFSNALNWQVAIGIPTVLFVQSLGANSFEIGLVFSWTFLLTPVQVLGTAWLPRVGFKRLALTGWVARNWCLVIPLVLTILARNGPQHWMVNAMIVTTFVYSVNRAIGLSALTTWFYQLIPESIRGRYWATDQMTAGIAITGSLLVYALLFTVLPLYVAFLILYTISVLGGWVARHQLRQLPDVDHPKLISLEKIVSETPRLMTEKSLFRTYLWMSVPLYAAITPIAPFAAYYLKATAGLSVAQVILLAMLTYVGFITANWIMRAKMDRVGTKRFFRLSYLTHAGIAVGWIAVLLVGPRAFPVLPLLYVVQGMASGFWTSANLSYLAKILPENDRALPVSIHGAVITFCGGCTPVLWGLFLKGSGPVPTVNVSVFLLFFVSLVIVCVVLMALLRRLPEQAAGEGEPLLPGSWAVRPFRALAHLINLVEKPDDKRGEDKH
jgi:hypothetical protein